MRDYRKQQINIYSTHHPAVAFVVPPPPTATPAATNSTFQLGYRPELDGVRGISILLVLGLHLAPGLLPGGFLGVDIFFVLSGFLITSLLLQEWSRRNSISLKDFYIRRVLRLGPGLAVFLLALGAYAFLRLNRENAHDVYIGILLTLSYVSNWFMALKPNMALSILAITWSLAVEEQFYLIWPLIFSLLLVLKVRRRWILTMLALGVVFVVVHRARLWHEGATFKRLYYGTDTHADGLLLGCLVGCLLSWDLIPQAKIFWRMINYLALLSAIFIVYFVLTTARTEPLLYSGGFSVAALAITVTLLALLGPASPATMLLRVKPLVWLGRISYGLYLWHWPVRGLVFGKSTQPSATQIIAAVVLTLVITSLSFYLIELPFLRWKKRFGHA
jgi:peptidoglycan/LPS O-acetylase OafA/YrhL